MPAPTGPVAAATKRDHEWLSQATRRGHRLATSVARNCPFPEINFSVTSPRSMATSAAGGEKQATGRVYAATPVACGPDADTQMLNLLHLPSVTRTRVRRSPLVAHWSGALML